MSRGRLRGGTKYAPSIQPLGLDDPEALARICGISPSHLEVLARSAQDLYGRVEIPKPSGGTRVIQPPSLGLKSVQRRILDHFSERTTWPPFVHGGVAGRSILSNARSHLRRAMVANLDVQSFFPTTTLTAVSASLLQFGLPVAVAELLCALITCPGEDGVRALPQGAPTSPFFANLAFGQVDQRFASFCIQRGLTYTRYIDDIAISGDNDLRPFKGTFVQLITDADYQVSASKMRFCGRDKPQIVTGLIVNSTLRPAPMFLSNLVTLIKNCYWPEGPGLGVIAALEGLTVSQLKQRIAGRIGYFKRFDPREARRLSALKFKRSANPSREPPNRPPSPARDEPPGALAEGAAFGGGHGAQ